MTAHRTAARKPPRRASARRPRGRPTMDQVLAWLDERLAADPDLRRRVARVVAALRREERAVARRQRRAR